VGPPSDWPQYAQFVVIIAVFAWLGRFGAETLMGAWVPRSAMPTMIR
jgi:hypothetical protein